MIIILFIGFLLYLITMLWLITGFIKLPWFNPKKTAPSTRFSILIPFRNEAANIPTLLGALSELEYPKEFFEIIFINDGSDDNGETLLLASKREVKFHFRILQNSRTSGSPKKDAINVGLQEAKFDWILTTDADCVVPKKWLQYYNQCIHEKQPQMICGPVLYRNGSSLVRQFQVLDGLSLQLVAMGSFGWRSPLLNNGANLAYRKQAFKDVGGYAGNDHIASGDDVFLLEKMKRAFPNGLHFLKTPAASVLTSSESNWNKAIQQRIRWASKISEQQSKGPKWIGGIVFFSNLLFLASLMGFIFFPKTGMIYLAYLFLKFALDVLALTIMAHFFKKAMPLFTSLVSVLVYPFIIIGVVFNGLRGTYTWKGRTHKK